jgi:hypothetical protein
MTTHAPSRAEVVPDLLPRIEAAARAVRDADDMRLLRTQQRDQLIVAAVDAGITQRAVAAAAGVSRSRIVGILLRDGALDELDLASER